MNINEKIKLLTSIDTYIKGELNQDEIDELWKEFLKHPEYFHYFETEVHLKSLLQKGKRPETFSQSSESKNISVLHTYKSWFLAAAAVLLLAIGLQFFALENQVRPDLFAIGEIDRYELIGSDIYRSDGEGVSDVDQLINEALAAALDNKTAKAIEILQGLSERSINEDQQVRVQLNLGILYYNEGNYSMAAEKFRVVTEQQNVSEAIAEKSWWFLGNTLLNTGNLVDARHAVYNAYTMNGRFQSPALALLKKLDVQLDDIPSE